MGVQSRGVSDTKLSVSLPKDFDDLSSLVYDLGDRFGATCDLKQSSEGASLVVWHDSVLDAGSQSPTLVPCVCGLVSALAVAGVVGLCIVSGVV